MKNRKKRWIGSIFLLVLILANMSGCGIRATESVAVYDQTGRIVGSYSVVTETDASYQRDIEEDLEWLRSLSEKADFGEIIRGKVEVDRDFIPQGNWVINNESRLNYHLSLDKGFTENSYILYIGDLPNLYNRYSARYYLSNESSKFVKSYNLSRTSKSFDGYTDNIIEPFKEYDSLKLIVIDNNTIQFLFDNKTDNTSNTSKSIKFIRNNKLWTIAEPAESAVPAIEENYDKWLKRKLEVVSNVFPFDGVWTFLETDKYINLKSYDLSKPLVQITEYGINTSPKSRAFVFYPFEMAKAGHFSLEPNETSFSIKRGLFQGEYKESPRIELHVNKQDQLQIRIPDNKNPAGFRVLLFNRYKGL